MMRCAEKMSKDGRHLGTSMRRCAGDSVRCMRWVGYYSRYVEMGGQMDGKPEHHGTRISNQKLLDGSASRYVALWETTMPHA